MTELTSELQAIDADTSVNKLEIFSQIAERMRAAGYTVVEQNTDKPWGSYLRLAGDDAEEFVEEFFTGLSMNEARLGNDLLELSPKILIASPQKRLSWQYHDRRAERWAFLNEGFYHRSMDDEQGARRTANAGDIVQFQANERHRLVGAAATYTLVAEIWQHTNPANPSEEGDIERVQDDFDRKSDLILPSKQLT